MIIVIITIIITAITITSIITSPISISTIINSNINKQYLYKMRPWYLGFWKNHRCLLMLKQEKVISLGSLRQQPSWCLMKAISCFIKGHLLTVSSQARRSKGLLGDQCSFACALIGFMSTTPSEPLPCDVTSQ